MSKDKNLLVKTMGRRDFRKRVISYYNTFAGVYDLAEFFRKGTREAMVRASGCKAGDWVLDICTGTGELALAFARQGIHTVAVDLARNMPKSANKNHLMIIWIFLKPMRSACPFQTNPLM